MGDEETEDSFKLDIDVNKSKQGDIDIFSETSIAPDVDIIVEQEPGTLPDSPLTLDFPDTDVHFGKRADDSSSSSSSSSDSDSDSEDEKVLPTDDKDKKKKKKTKEKKERKEKKPKEKKEKEPKEKKGKKTKDEKVKDKETEDSFKLDIDVDKSKAGEIAFVSETSIAPDVDISVEQEPGTLPDSSVTLDFPDSDFHFGKRADDSSSSSSSSSDSDSDSEDEDEKDLPTDDKDKKKEKKTKEKKEKKSKEKKEK